MSQTSLHTFLKVFVYYSSTIINTETFNKRHLNNKLKHIILFLLLLFLFFRFGDDAKFLRLASSNFTLEL